MKIYVLMSEDRDGIGNIYGAFDGREKFDMARRKLSQSPAVNGADLKGVVLELNVARVPTIGEPWVEKVPIGDAR